MKRQCECGNAGDEIVFGLRHQCEPIPEPKVIDSRLVPSWMFTVPEEPPWATTLGPDEVYE